METVVNEFSVVVAGEVPRGEAIIVRSEEVLAVTGIVNTRLFLLDLVFRRFWSFGTSRKNGSNIKSDSL